MSIAAASPVIILVRPQMAENIGMAARAMANFGLAELRLVAPRDGWPPADEGPKGMTQAAAGATHVLDALAVFDRLEDAVGDLNYLFATTARERGQAKPVHLPQEGMALAAGRVASGQRVGILFGPERTGLENDEIALADSVLTFPVDPAFSSLNLAQAVLLVSYAWVNARGAVAAPFSLPHNTGPARRETLLSFFAFLDDALERAGFFQGARAPVMRRNFRNIIHRMEPTEQDIRTLRGALVALITGGRGNNRGGDAVSRSGEEG